MHVNWKRPVGNFAAKSMIAWAVAFSAVLAVFSILHGCVASPKPSVSGSLVVLSGDGVSVGLTASAINIKTKGEGSRALGMAKFASSRSLSRDFVPGELIVKYKPGFDPERNVKGALSSRFVLARNDRNIARGALALMKVAENMKGKHTLETLRDLTLREIDRLKTEPYVQYAEPNYIYRPLFVPDDPNYENAGTLFQWHYPLIRLDSVWDDAAVPLDLSGIRVAVIDTGIARSGGFTHDDFREGTDDIFEYEYSTITDAPDATELSADYYHGTHVTGTVAAITNNGLFVAGVAGGNKVDNKKSVRVIPLRAIDEDTGGSPLNIARAIRYAAGLPDTNQPPNPIYPTLSTPAKVINLSLGGPSSQTLADAVKAAHAAEVVIVAAAGNEYYNEAIYPAAYPEVISVGAVTAGGEKSPYSNYGGRIDITAPGGSGVGEAKLDLDFNSLPDDVLSTSKNGSFGTRYLAGTSMAAPHVAGAAALVINAYNQKRGFYPSADTVKDILTAAATPAGPSCYYGAGLLNVYKAVKTALQEGEATGSVWAFPRTVRISGNPPSGTFVLKNIGMPGIVQVTDIAVNSDHTTDQLSGGFIESISPATGTADSVNGLAVTVTAKAGFAFSTSLHYAELKITGVSGTDLGRVYVMYKYSDPVYVTVFDYDTGDLVAYTTTSSEQGYRFEFPSLDAGSYVIGASTDRNGDGFIFEDGEAFGYYNTEIYGKNVYNYEVVLSNGDVITDMNFPIIDWE